MVSCPSGDLQRHVATQGRQRRRIRRTRRDSTEQVDTVSVNDGEMTGDDVWSHDDGDDALAPVDERTWNKTSNVDGKG